jgi:hypothetical protein
LPRSSAALDQSVRHARGEQDEVVNQIGLSVLSAMMTRPLPAACPWKTAARRGKEDMKATGRHFRF